MNIAKADRRLGSLVVVAIVVCLAAGCRPDGGAIARCGPNPAHRPKRMVEPDRYAQVFGPKVARFWLTAEAQQRPTELALAGGSHVVVDAQTKLFGRCVHPCWTYVVLRSHTQVADALYPTVIRHGAAAQLTDSVWHVGDRVAVMSSGLQLKLALGANVSLNDSELRRLGDWVTISIDNHGAVTKLEHTAFGCT